MDSGMTSNANPQCAGALDDLELLPMLAPGSVTELGTTVVVAPHPDDETLGCGGLIALLHRSGNAVRVLVTSDGTGSHPNSRAYPPRRLRDVRESEAISAVGVLGLDEQAISFLRLPDTRVPHPHEPEFEDAVERCRAALLTDVPDTIVLPWRRDSHNDHQATWHIVHQAMQRAGINARTLEYPIWVWDLDQPDDMPRPGEMRGWRLDISPALQCKLTAIAAYRSQTTDLIDDDPDCFRLQPETLQHFQRPWEIYLEPNHD